MDSTFIFKKLNLKRPEICLNILDIRAPQKKLKIKNFIVNHHNRYSLIEFINEEDKIYLLEFLLNILDLGAYDSNIKFYKSPYSAVILDDVFYEYPSLEYAKACLLAKNIKLIWTEETVASHYYYWFSKKVNTLEE